MGSSATDWIFFIPITLSDSDEGFSRRGRCGHLAQGTMIVLAIDPGPTQSACLLWKDGKVSEAKILRNEDLIATLPLTFPDVTVIEMVACYGMAVGKEVFETCVWIGRFYERCQHTPRLVYRRDIKMHHCQNVRAKDANIRQALIDKYGPPGTKKAPGLTYGIKSHLWAAFALATFETEFAAPQPSFAVVA